MACDEATAEGAQGNAVDKTLSSNDLYDNVDEVSLKISFHSDLIILFTMILFAKSCRVARLLNRL